MQLIIGAASLRPCGARLTSSCCHCDQRRVARASMCMARPACAPPNSSVRGTAWQLIPHLLQLSKPLPPPAVQHVALCQWQQLSCQLSCIVAMLLRYGPHRQPVEPSAEQPVNGGPCMVWKWVAAAFIKPLIRLPPRLPRHQCLALTESACPSQKRSLSSDGDPPTGSPPARPPTCRQKSVQQEQHAAACTAPRSQLHSHSSFSIMPWNC